MNRPLRAHLICGGEFHDFAFAESELSKLLGEQEHIVVTTGADYSDHESIKKADFLLTYTNNVTPSAE